MPAEGLSAPPEPAAPAAGSGGAAAAPASAAWTARLARFARRPAVLAAVGARLAAYAVAVAWAFHHRQAGQGVYDLLVTPWTHKDAGWFVRIAQSGYAGHGRAAFFPLYPLLLRGASVLTLGNLWVAGMAVSLLCYGAAMVLLYRLTAAEAGERAATGAVVLIAVFPTAFVFNAVYSESLFLLLTVTAFYLARRRRWAAACAAGFLAVLTRSSGLALAVPLLLLYAGQQGWLTRRPRFTTASLAGAAWVLLVPTGLVVYMIYLWARFGDALLFMRVQRTAWHRTLDWPWVDVGRALRLARHGVDVLAQRSLSLAGFVPGHRLEVVSVRTLLPLATLVFALVCLVPVFRRLPLAFGVYSVLALLEPLLEPSRIQPLYSYHRFVLVVFPLFMGLGIALQRRRLLLWVVAALSLALMLYLTVCFTSVNVRAHGVV